MSKKRLRGCASRGHVFTASDTLIHANRGKREGVKSRWAGEVVGAQLINAVQRSPVFTPVCTQPRLDLACTPVCGGSVEATVLLLAIRLGVVSARVRHTHSLSRIFASSFRGWVELRSFTCRCFGR